MIIVGYGIFSEKWFVLGGKIWIINKYDNCFVFYINIGKVILVVFRCINVIVNKYNIRVINVDFRVNLLSMSGKIIVSVKV